MKRFVFPDERPLDLVEGPSVLGLLHVLVLDWLLIEFIDADSVGIRQPTFSYLFVRQLVLQPASSSFAPTSELAITSHSAPESIRACSVSWPSLAFRYSARLRRPSWW